MCESTVGSFGIQQNRQHSTHTDPVQTFTFTYFFFRFMFLEATMVSEMEIMESLLSIVRAPRDQQDAGGFVYTPREIAQQPESWQGTLNIFTRDQARICGF